MDDSARHHPHLHPEHPRHAAMEVVRTLRAAGHIAYFAGGCVRDELLGREPDDYDVATDAIPDRISALFRQTNHVGASFGVVLVRHGDSRNAGTVEVATFRSDGTYSDRRRPDQVHFSDPAADARRRDFTVNALYLDPINDPDSPAHHSLPGSPSLYPGPPSHGGTVVDFVGGMQDLKDRLLRAVGVPDQRLAEDHLRALRAVRLSAKLGFRIDPGTADAIRRHAAELGGVSRERIGDEIRLMMALPSRASSAATLADLGLDVAVFGAAPARPPASPSSPPVLAGLPDEVAFSTCLSAWALDRDLTPQDLRAPDREQWHGKPAPPLANLCTRWRKGLCLSNEERDGLCWTLLWVGVLVCQWPTLSVAHRRRTAAFQSFPAARQVLEACALASQTDRTLIEQIDADILKLTPAGEPLCPAPFVTGDDLVAAGHKPGPGYRKLLEQIYDAQLESRIASRDEGLELARGLGV